MTDKARENLIIKSWLFWKSSWPPGALEFTVPLYKDSSVNESPEVSWDTPYVPTITFKKKKVYEYRLYCKRYLDVCYRIVCEDVILDVFMEKVE